MTAITNIKYIDIPEFGRLNIRDGSKVNVGGLVSQAEVGDGSLAGLSQKFEVPFIECTVIHQSGLSLTALAAIRNTNVTMQTDTGSAYVLQEAAVEGAVELSGAEIPLRLIGSRLEEIRA